VHDYFDILGVAPGAPASLIRRASARRGAAVHPDFRPVATVADGPEVPDSSTLRVADAHVTFIDMCDLVDRMEAAFFQTRE
jgi:hypothetical protein